MLRGKKIEPKRDPRRPVTTRKSRRQSQYADNKNELVIEKLLDEPHGMENVLSFIAETHLLSDSRKGDTETEMRIGSARVPVHFDNNMCRTVNESPDNIRKEHPLLVKNEDDADFNKPDYTTVFSCRRSSKGERSLSGNRSKKKFNSDLEMLL